MSEQSGAIARRESRLNPLSEVNSFECGNSCGRLLVTTTERLSGRMQVPFLRDPNTGAQMFESADIRRYLYDTYAA